MKTNDPADVVVTPPTNTSSTTPATDTAGTTGTTGTPNIPSSQLPSTVVVVNRGHEVLHTIKNHTIVAMGVGIIPAPGVDLIALTVIQLNMLRRISALYKLPFSDEIGKKLIAALLGGYLPLALVAPIASVLKFIPGVGMLAGVLAQSATAGATTYAIGNIFAQHFETGGNLLNFNPAEMTEKFRHEVQEGKEFVKTQAGKVGNT
jgi:uncharacterized protein (DUF697 family)